MKNKRTIFAVALVVVLGVTGVGVYIGTKDKGAEIVTKETEVAFGNLTVGVTESGAVSLGNVEQSFDIDLSGDDSESSNNSSSVTQSMGGNGVMPGMNMASGSNNTGGQSSTESSSADGVLEVEEVYVSEGQVVEKGEALLKLTDDSVKNARAVLSQKVKSAKLTLEKAKIERKSTKLSAKYEYEANIVTGKNAKKDYNNTIESLSNAVEEAQDAIDEAEKRLKEIPNEVKKLKAKKASASKTTTTKNASTPSDLEADVQTGNQTLENEIGSISNENASNPSNSSKEDNTASIDSQISALESELSSIKKNYSNLANRLSQAKSEQTAGKITAKEKYDQAILNYENAKDIYEIAIDGVDDSVDEAKEELKDAKENLVKFEEFVLDGTITTEYAGTILAIGYEKGDSLSSDTAIASYADENSVEVTVAVSQDDISNVEVGENVNILFHAYKDEEYNGTVTEISNQESSNSTTVSYDVTVNVQGDVSKIYDGMTANVTFVTKEIKDVVYVSNKAIQNEGTKSYVTLVKDGVNKKVQVTTGFSNGTNVEITDGLSKGDIVLIESQVNKS